MSSLHLIDNSHHRVRYLLPLPEVISFVGVVGSGGDAERGIFYYDSTLSTERFDLNDRVNAFIAT